MWIVITFIYYNRHRIFVAPSFQRQSDEAANNNHKKYVNETKAKNYIDDDNNKMRK